MIQHVDVPQDGMDLLKATRMVEVALHRLNVVIDRVNTVAGDDAPRVQCEGCPVAGWVQWLLAHAVTDQAPPKIAEGQGPRGQGDRT